MKLKSLTTLKFTPEQKNWANATLSDSEFILFADLIYAAAGVRMTPVKKALVQGRLAKRLRHFRISSFHDYYLLIKKSPEEHRIATDLLTTHETSFFRDQSQFDFLENSVLPSLPSARVWSAACSTGEEVYSIGMILQSKPVLSRWEIVGTDISERVLDYARRAQYPARQTAEVPDRFLKKFCLKGIGPMDGVFKISPIIRSCVTFRQANLLDPAVDGVFDIVYLRNVIIYFDSYSRREAIRNIQNRLKKGGYLFVGSSEMTGNSLAGFTAVRPSIYRKL